MYPVLCMQKAVGSFLNWASLLLNDAVEVGFWVRMFCCCCCCKSWCWILSQPKTAHYRVTALSEIVRAKLAEGTSSWVFWFSSFFDMAVLAHLFTKLNTSGAFLVWNVCVCLQRPIDIYLLSLILLFASNSVKLVLCIVFVWMLQSIAGFSFFFHKLNHFTCFLKANVHASGLDDVMLVLLLMAPRHCWALLVAGPKLWNLLPSSVSLVSSLCCSWLIYFYLHVHHNLLVTRLVLLATWFITITL